MSAAKDQTYSLLGFKEYLPKHALSDLVGTDPLRIETAINIGTTK